MLGTLRDMWTALLGVATLGLGCGFFLWLIWPDRKGSIAVGHRDQAELDDLIASVGNVDRPRVPGESGVGSEGAGFG